MKIRNGFVSNSSSSSFILFGVSITKDNILNIESCKLKFDEEFKKTEKILIQKWNNLLNDPDFEKHKNVYEMCKLNNVSIPKETFKFFGYGFNGIFEPQKPNEEEIYSDLLDSGTFNFPNKISILRDDDVSYLGNLISYSDESNGNLSIDNINKYTQNLLEMGFNIDDIKLYYGTVNN